MNEIPLSPAEVIKQNLVERNWTQMDLAFLLGWGNSEVSQLLSEKKNFKLEIARDLAIVFDTTTDFWLDIHRKHELSKLGEADQSITKRTKLFKNFPIKEMQKRNWIPPTDDIDALEKHCLSFFQINSLDESPILSYAAKKSSSYSETSIQQAAWLKRARQLAPAIMAKKFSAKAFSETMEKLQLLLFEVADIRQIPKVLAEGGIRLLIIEPLPGGKIDGATLWIDEYSPVIVLSLRFDRIDSFWHSLFHEISHVKNGEGKGEPIIDIDLLSEDNPSAEKPEFEKRADRDAAESSIPKELLDSFIMRIHPMYADQKLLGFAALNKIHAGVLVGQLHHRFNTTGKGLPFSHQRKFLVKLRSIITEPALTDGYGYRPLI